MNHLCNMKPASWMTPSERQCRPHHEAIPLSKAPEDTIYADNPLLQSLHEQKQTRGQPIVMTADPENPPQTPRDP
jgi:hypothetical protein